MDDAGQKSVKFSTPQEQSELFELYGMPGHLIRSMNQISTSVFAAETAKAGFDLTPVQFAALKVIRANPGLDQATLANAIAYDRVTIGGVIDRLEGKGLVRREIAKGDRRSRRLHLQAEGEKLLRGVEPVVLQAQVKILQGLSEKDRAGLMRLMRKALDKADHIR